VTFVTQDRTVHTLCTDRFAGSVARWIGQGQHHAELPLLAVQSGYASLTYHMLRAESVGAVTGLP